MLLCFGCYVLSKLFVVVSGNVVVSLLIVVLRCMVNCSQLTRRGTHLFYTGIYLPSVGYCLPVTHFTKGELDDIQLKPHRAMLSHKGYNCNTAKAVSFGPQPLGAIEMYHLYDTQGFGQASLVIKSWRSPHTLQSRTMKIAVHWAQYTSGISAPILAAPHLKLPHLESKWLQSLRDYLVAVHGCI